MSVDHVRLRLIVTGEAGIQVLRDVGVEDWFSRERGGRHIYVLFFSYGVLRTTEHISAFFNARSATGHATLLVRRTFSLLLV